MRVRDVSMNEFNAIVNEPDVLVYVNPEADRIDLAHVYRQPGVLVKGCEGVRGAVLLLPYPGNAYEIHWYMPGYAGIKAVKAIVDWMFEHTNTDVLFGPTPAQNIAARLVNRWLGGEIIGRMEDGFKRPCVVYSLTREQWASRRKKPQT